MRASAVAAGNLRCGTWFRVPARIRRGVIAAFAGALLSLPAFGAGPAQTASQAPEALRAPAAQLSSAYARHLAELINEYRAANGLGPLRLVSDLNALAAEHSEEMAEQRRLSHEGFRARFDRTTARICVENVGVNFPRPEAQLDGWRASPGHLRNLLEPKVVRMGIAQSHAFVTFFACS